MSPEPLCVAAFKRNISDCDRTLLWIGIFSGDALLLGALRTAENVRLIETTIRDWPRSSLRGTGDL